VPVLSQRVSLSPPQVRLNSLESEIIVGQREYDINISYGPGSYTSTNASMTLTWDGGQYTNTQRVWEDFVVGDLAALGLIDGQDALFGFGSYPRATNTLPVRLFTQNGDYYGDGLTNGMEYDVGFDLTSQDSDGDGTLDIDEDADNDGLTSAEELALVPPTDPT